MRGAFLDGFWARLVYCRYGIHGFPAVYEWVDKLRTLILNREPHI